MSPLANMAFVTVKTAAQLMDTSESALRARIKRREFPIQVLKRFGKRSLRFDAQELNAWLKSRNAY
jgi:predicted DNA-binding transcriptional regulator AlpA